MKYYSYGDSFERSKGKKKEMFAQVVGIKRRAGMTLRGEVEEFAGLYIVVLRGSTLMHVTPDDVDGTWPCIIGTDLDEIADLFEREDVPLTWRRGGAR